MAATTSSIFSGSVQSSLISTFVMLQSFALNPSCSYATPPAAPLPLELITQSVTLQFTNSFGD
jgi:hypothetical protein